MTLKPYIFPTMSKLRYHHDWPLALEARGVVGEDGIADFCKEFAFAPAAPETVRTGTGVGE